MLSRGIGRLQANVANGYSYRVQWEHDWNFVHRSPEEASVFGRFEQAENGKGYMLMPIDDQYFVPALSARPGSFSCAPVCRLFPLDVRTTTGPASAVAHRVLNA